MTIARMPLNGIASRLAADGLLTEETAREAFEKSRAEKISFVAYLIRERILLPKQIATAASADFGVPLFDLDSYNLEFTATDSLNERNIEKFHVLPLFKRDNRLYIAVSDPTNLKALDEIKFRTGLNTHAILVEEDKLGNAIRKVVDAQEEAALGDLTDSDLDSLDISAEEPKDSHENESDDDAPIVRFVNKVLLDAITQSASDIHFEPYEKKYRVRFRMDGILHEIASPPAKLAGRICARLKVMSRLDISERRIPQDGRFKMNLSKSRSIDFRISTCPTLYGEKLVLRILDQSSATLEIDQLGYEPFQKELFLEHIKKPQGMVLVTGPTGSGKTVSLYTALNILNVAEKNISTVEDPVEINLPGINQVNVNLKTGLDFSTALRSFLRQDPDIIMLGEIRDLETAEIAIKAAQTGHLVLSTLHTNSAAETLSRLANMGIAPFNIATSVSLIIAQRLARKLCPHCKKEESIPKEALIAEGFDEATAADMTVYGAKGCSKCVAGYRGRVGIYEVMPMTEGIGRKIMSGGSAIDILDQAKKEGLQTLRQSGLEKICQGLTSLEEINRVTKD